MRHLFFFVLAILCVQLVEAQRAQKVYPITKEMRPHDWYIDQIAAWQKVISKDPGDAEAWFYFYTATRAAAQTNQSNHYRIGEDEQKEMDEILVSMKKHIPNSFAYHYTEWWHAGNDAAYFHHLQKAYEIDPTRPEQMDSWATYYEMNNQPEKRKEFMQKWYQTNDISPRLLAYNYNVLMSVAPNGIIITNGDNDTYPLWMLQDVQGIRTDVIVLNRSLMIDDAYREGIFKRVGIREFPQSFSKMKSMEEYHQLEADLLDHLTSQPKHPLHFALTCAPNIQEAYEDDLYVVGLASRYDEDGLDNIAMLRNVYENLFILDYLLLPTHYESKAASSRLTDMNYITPLVMLYEHYALSGDVQRKQEVARLCRRIAAEADMKTEVEELLK